MAESQAISEEAVYDSLSWSSGGIFSIAISSSINAQVIRTLCTADQTGAIDTGYQMVTRKINAAITKSLGGERDDQKIQEAPGSLHVPLHCFTDQRFLEVLEEYENGRIKERLLEEFLDIGIELEGLSVEVKNIEEVKSREVTINKRSSLSPLGPKFDLALHFF
jgi:hypothetical protein